MAARDYTVRGSGWVSFDQHLDISATLSASRKLTDDLLSTAKPLRSLTAGDGRLEIPFRLKGTFSDPRVRVDSDFILRALQHALLGEGLDKFSAARERSGAARRRRQRRVDRQAVAKGTGEAVRAVREAPGAPCGRADVLIADVLTC